MNTTQPPFDERQGAPGGQLRDQPGDQIERLFAGELRRPSRSSRPGVPGYEKLDLYPFDMAKAKALLKEAQPLRPQRHLLDRQPQRRSRRKLRSSARRNRLRREAESRQRRNYFTVIGDEKTPDLDLGYAGFGADYPNPNAFFEPLLSGASILPTNNTNLSRIDDPVAQQEDRTAGGRTARAHSRKRNTPRSTRPTWNRRRSPPTATRPRRSSSPATIDFGDVIWNPIFSGDLTSFQFK